MKTLLPLFFCFIFLQVKATTWTVTVSSNQFTPSSLNVVVGDVIQWVWSSGVHTTTSLSVPAGGATWDASIINTSTTFNYTVTAAGSYSYECSIHTPLMSGSFTATSALPVTISSFNISTQNNKPLISWTTQTELNSDYFSISKSTNGRDFKEIGKVKAAGNSSVEKNYSFSDEKISETSKYVYYVLATVDKDGKTQLSPIKIYRNKSAASKLIISLSPNPISEMGHLMLKYNADKSGIMIAKLIDMQGKIILKTELSAVQGVNNGHIHLGDVSPGVYTFVFSLDGINESYRITKK
ncbi:MAG: T9SS type A sorting domain-containing protein [Chitinophagaceae bacterium]|nr:T9SS type A sorting domain-containing protein [Chitinophagaceae bacterium]